MIQFDSTKHKLEYTFNYNPDETRNLKDIFNEIRTNEGLTIDDLRRVSLWKIDRVLQIPEELIKNLDSLAKDQSITIHDDNVKQIITNLTNCQGVGFPMASAMLKFLRPDVFPIIDVRAYRALFGKKNTTPNTQWINITSTLKKFTHSKTNSTCHYTKLMNSFTNSIKITTERYRNSSAKKISNS